MELWIPSVILSAFFWSLGYFFLKLNSQSNNIIETYLFLFSGQILAVLVILSLYIYHKNGDIKFLNNIFYSKYSILAGIVFTLGTLIFTYSIKYGKNLPSVRIIGIVCEIIFVILLSCLFLKEKISLINYFGILITLIGISIITYFK